MEEKKTQGNAFFKDLQHVCSINLYLLPKVWFPSEDYFGIESLSKGDLAELEKSRQRGALESSCPSVWTFKHFFFCGLGWWLCGGIGPLGSQQECNCAVLGLMLLLWNLHLLPNSACFWSALLGEKSFLLLLHIWLYICQIVDQGLFLLLINVMYPFQSVPSIINKIWLPGESGDIEKEPEEIQDGISSPTIGFLAFSHPCLDSACYPETPAPCGGPLAPFRAPLGAIFVKEKKLDFSKKIYLI